MIKIHIQRTIMISNFTVILFIQWYPDFSNLLGKQELVWKSASSMMSGRKQVFGSKNRAIRKFEYLELKITFPCEWVPRL